MGTKNLHICVSIVNKIENLHILAMIVVIGGKQVSVISKTHDGSSMHLETVIQQQSINRTNGRAIKVLDLPIKETERVTKQNAY